ncbi:MAG: 30S ribosomal protein S8e [Candidatus Micrarchaeia archaeon]
MENYHGRKLTKAGTGGKKRKFCDKKLCQEGGEFSSTRIGETEKKKKRVRGGSFKYSLKKEQYANVVMKDKTIKRVKIISVVESPNNREYKRMNIITKGVIIETEVGKAKVTSRPGQDGVVNAVLL